MWSGPVDAARCPLRLFADVEREGTGRDPVGSIGRVDLGMPSAREHQPVLAARRDAFHAPMPPTRTTTPGEAVALEDARCDRRAIVGGAENDELAVRRNLVESIRESVERDVDAALDVLFLPLGRGAYVKDEELAVARVGESLGQV